MPVMRTGKKPEDADADADADCGGGGKMHHQKKQSVKSAPKFKSYRQYRFPVEKFACSSSSSNSWLPPIGVLGCLDRRLEWVLINSSPGTSLGSNSTKNNQTFIHENHPNSLLDLGCNTGDICLMTKLALYTNDQVCKSTPVFFTGVDSDNQAIQKAKWKWKMMKSCLGDNNFNDINDSCLLAANCRTLQSNKSENAQKYPISMPLLYGTIDGKIDDSGDEFINACCWEYLKSCVSKAKKFDWVFAWSILHWMNVDGNAGNAKELASLLTKVCAKLLVLELQPLKSHQHIISILLDDYGMKLIAQSEPADKPMFILSW